ncbi:hypothetical protein D8674_009928 [Pyrus ussuriensis x Pyrus communis]|uniref:Bifunctional inhibitor/plant lipid transfer protein/seed storage helical domain-containing protein n=1 Tax=Pyrus ussuriensis x Pyrus communis TaxID=2448454 RepID=A0A5N5F9N0_9ROSA|nr:hypothetical protein D8674_009928 [Pyrus ussuriensis x Pyrus communis]
MITTATAPPPLMAILLALTLAIISTEPAEPPSPLPSCGDELVRFSPCLPYVSSPPNNLSDSPPPKCCDAFSLSLESGGALCLCYLVQDPPMLGFPVNGSRVLFLSSTCPLGDISTNTSSAESLESLCSGSPELPPLRSSTISEISPPPSGFESVGNASSPLMSLAPESANTTSIPPGNRSPTPPSSAVYPARVSAAVKQIHTSNIWFLPAPLSFLVSMSS